MRLMNLLGKGLAALAAVLLTGAPAWGCTSAVVSGKATPDGRPLLWKNRDTDCLRNHVAWVKGERYDFIADVNSDNFARRPEAWIGTNSAGFAVMNTQSYNLVELKEGEERGAANGRIMYRALEVCATVEDFCHLLDTIAKPSGIEANFGVIDAQGGAAMLEVDYEHYVMYDANDARVAPYGYIARTNFSFAGRVNEGGGYVRYMEAERVLMQASATGGITPQGILNDLSRSFHNCLLGVDLRKGDFNVPQGSGWFVDQDFIPRGSTSCSVVVQGVKPGEAAELTTMWTLLGYPPTGIAVPLWVKGGERGMPAMVALDSSLGAAPLSHASLQRAADVFGYRQGMGTDRYLHWECLYNAQGSGYLQQLPPLEAQVFDLSLPVLEAWRKGGCIDIAQQRTLYQNISQLLEEYLEE